MLPTFNENELNTFDSTTDKLFIIGCAPNAACALDGGFVICPSLKNEGTFSDKFRSSANDENKKVPDNIININEKNELASHLCSYPGMSGGAILICRIDTEDAKKNANL